MRFMFTRFVGSTVAIAATALSAALAADQTVQGHASGQAVGRPEETKVLTGKERLGNKWMDEQRVDNCKVPSISGEPSRAPTHVSMRPPSDRSTSPRHAHE
jgi:hypothetical protein